MRRRLVVGLVALVFGVLWASPAWANDCGNFSRTANGATPWETSRGRWFLISTPIGTFWVFGSPDNFMNGAGGALLDSATCPEARFLGQTQGGEDLSRLQGIWSESCFAKATGG